jgi:hypothetical protein
MTDLKRSPWLIPIIVALVAIALFFGIVFTRAGELVGLNELLGHWVVNAVLFCVFALAALIAYRTLRRSRAPAAMDEARSRGGRS